LPVRPTILLSAIYIFLSITKRVAGESNRPGKLTVRYVLAFAVPRPAPTGQALSVRARGKYYAEYESVDYGF